MNQSLTSLKSITDRREFIEGHTKTSLHNIAHYTVDESQASTKNCENMIGVAQIPLGVAGPLLVNHFHSQKSQEYYLPLATTEGALVASINRGAKAGLLSSGITATAQKVGVTRGPVFAVSTIADQNKFSLFLRNNFEKFKEIAQTTSSHISLLKYEEKAVVPYTFVKFYFDTQDAMGMNMATIACDAISEFISQETGHDCLALSGNFCMDKKPSSNHLTQGRGISVQAQCILSEETIHTVLKTSPQKMFDVWQAKCIMGSIVSGGIGFNAQVANVIAALFIATGQDPAHVVEASHAITTMELSENKNELHCSVSIPSLMVGTVGGGTSLATQKEALAILGIVGGNDTVLTFAEIVVSAVLCGEISLISSLAQKNTCAVT